MIAALPRIFAVLMLIFGMLIVFILPPTQAPDEYSHLIRSVMVAKGDLSIREESGKYGQDVPASLVAFADSHRSIVFRNDVKYPYARWYADSHRLATYEPTVFLHYSAQNASPLLYVPQAAGIWAAQLIAAPLRGLGFSWPAAQYGARLGNLIMFICVGCLAIAYVQRYRLIIFAAATLPMVVQQAASSSYDATTIAVAIGFFALLAGLLERGRPPRRIELVLLLLCAFMLGHAKAAYAPLLLSAVALHKIMPKREFVTLLGGMGAVAIVGALLTTIVLGVPEDPLLVGRYQAQSDWLASHVWSVPSLVFRSVIEQRDFLVIGYFANFGALDTNWSLPTLVVPMLTLIVAVVGDSMDEKRIFDWKDKFAIVAGVTGSVFAFHLAMYIVWTSIMHPEGVGAELVNGVQGRYFLPLTAFSLCIFAALPKNIACRFQSYRNDIGLVQVSITCVGLCFMLFAMIIRYWVPIV